MRFGSLFSGIEAASVAWGPLGWKCQWVAEIEKFPSAVLAHHYPDVPNLGDVTKVDWEKISATRPVDAIVFGSPCQSFSVAGKRLGLDDPRGNLALYALSVVDRLRPDWFVFENVPGLLSSGEGRDFGAFLGTVGDIGYQCAWRVLDAQYFGLAQRRARVFVVGHLGDWRRAAAVLFERESLRWHPAPRREAGQRIANSLTERPDRGGGNSEGQRLIAPTLPSRTRGGGGLGTDLDCDGGLIPEISMCLNAGGMGRQDSESESETLIAHIPDREEATSSGDIRDSIFPFGKNLDASENGTGRGTPIVQAFYSTESRCDNLPEPGLSPPLKVGTNSGGSAPAIAFSAKDHGADAGEISPTLRSGGHDKSHANGGVMPAVAFNWQSGGDGRGLDPRDSVSALTRYQTPALAASAVRRLTPRECERLQGFPEIHRKVTIRVCGSEEEKRALASSAEPHSPARNRALSEPVVAHVLIDLERSAVQLHKAGRLIWSASGAEPSSASPLSMPLADFVRVAAAMTTTAAPQIHAGKVASPLSISSSLPRWSGSAFVPVFGREIRGPASDVAASAAGAITSITSQLGRHSPTNAATLETLSCCVVGAIASCIREQIQSGNSFSVSVETHAGYTAVPYRGKPAADGPRYKALGNSMAVPVMAWIGRRIALVQSLSRPEAA